MIHIDQLYRDHQNIARVLKCLEINLDQLGSNDQPDLQLMSCCLQYLIRYTDEVHHPWEDAIFSYVVETNPEYTGLVEKLESDHKKLAAYSQTVDELISAATNDQVVERELLIDQGRKYISAQFQHMRFEEDELFSFAKDKLSESDWHTLTATVTLKSDPIFKERRNPEFSRLWDYIDQTG